MTTQSHKKIIFLPVLIACAMFFVGCGFLYSTNESVQTPPVSANQEINNNLSNDPQENKIVETSNENTEIIKDAETQNTENVEDTEILYNPDGTIDTSNWKDYKSENYHFSIIYPNNFTWKKQNIQFGGFLTNIQNVDDVYMELQADETRILFSASVYDHFSQDFQKLSIKNVHQSYENDYLQCERLSVDDFATEEIFLHSLCFGELKQKIDHIKASYIATVKKDKFFEKSAMLVKSKSDIVEKSNKSHEKIFQSFTGEIISH